MSQWLLTILVDGRYLSEDDCIHALLYPSFGNQRNEWVLQIAAPAPNRLILSMTSRSRSSVSGPLPTTTPCPYLPRTALLSITRTMSSSHAAANRFLSVCATTTDDTAFPLSSKQGNGNHDTQLSEPAPPSNRPTACKICRQPNRLFIGCTPCASIPSNQLGSKKSKTEILSVSHY